MENPDLPVEAWAALVDRALCEDLGGIAPDRDLTAARTVPEKARTQARMIARKSGVIAGLVVARAVFARLDPDIAFRAQVDDGASVSEGEELVHLEGSARALLAGERTALNFLQRLSGVATLTARYAAQVRGTGARITDTRKTTPGYRLLEKWAVRLGGGVNHRFGLYDAVLIKENHAAAAGGVARAVRSAREAGDAVPVYAEARTLQEVRDLVEVAPERIMLDNMSLEDMAEAVRLIRRSAKNIDIEATGGFTLDTVRRAAETGVDLISVGALTHSAPALDLSMLFENV